MSPEIQIIWPNVIHSVFKFFAEYEYTVGTGTPKTLVQHLGNGLKIRAGYPDDLTEITEPVLAICSPDELGVSEEFFGEDLVEYESVFYLYGFTVVGDRAHTNRVYRDRFFNDVFHLMSGPAGSEGIDLYDHVTKTLIGSIEVDQPRGRHIPVNLIGVPADRYKFVVTAGVHYV